MLQNYNIYKISSDNCEKVYIGITKKDIEKRLKEHVCCYELFNNNNNKNFITSYEIIKNGNYKIELIESFTPKDNQEKKEREAYYIKTNNSVIKRIENRTQKEWTAQNWERVKEHKLKYYYNNKEKFIIYRLKKKNELLKDKLNEIKQRVDIANSLLLTIKDIKI